MYRVLILLFLLMLCGFRCPIEEVELIYPPGTYKSSNVEMFSTTMDPNGQASVVVEFHSRKAGDVLSGEVSFYFKKDGNTEKKEVQKVVPMHQRSYTASWHTWDTVIVQLKCQGLDEIYMERTLWHPVLTIKP